MVRDCSRVTYKTNLEVLTHKWPVLRSCAPDETETALSKLLNWAFEHIIQNAGLTWLINLELIHSD